MKHHEATPAAELGLAAVGLTVVASFDRVFESGYLGPLLATLAVVQGIDLLARRRGWNLPQAAAMTLVAVSLVLAWTVFWETTRFGLPTPTTLEVARGSLQDGWEAFRDVTAPSPPLPGLVVSAAAGVAFAMFLADWAAFRLWSPLEALVAPFALVVFCILLGEDDHPILATSLFAVAVLVFLLAHRLALTRGGPRRTSALTALGSAMVVLAVAGGTVVAQVLPGAGEEALIEWGSEDEGGGQRTTISPLVDIRNRIADRSDLDVFQVRSNERSYWRLTSLDSYAEGVWRSSGRYRAVDGSLPDVTEPAESTEIDQVVTIQTLEAIWLPAAFQPVAVEADQKVRWKADSSTLIVDSSLPTSDGMVYEVRSSRPVTSPEDLRRFDGTSLGELDEDLVEVPSRDGSIVRDVVREVVAGQPTPYDELIALQDWFRTEFTYDLGVPPGHGADAIASFLAVRRGYCEQFAGTFAVMARTLGYPARVAVGFTTGEESATDPGVYQVRGEHAHAWPEVWMGEENGWVQFEPTPGRGAPGAEHTGVPEQQDTSGPAQDPTTTETTATTETTDTTAGGSPPSSTAPTADDQAVEAAAEAGAEPEGPGGVLLVAVLIAAATVAYLIAVPLLLELRRRRRRSRATTPAERVEVAWREVVEALGDVGASHHGDETNMEYVRRLPLVSEDLTAEVATLRRLAETTDEARFGGGEPTPGAVTSAEEGSAQVRRSLRSRRSLRQRLRAAVDPRPLLGPRRRRHTLGPR